jgi:hypothetical protein
MLLALAHNDALATAILQEHVGTLLKSRGVACVLGVGRRRERLAGARKPETIAGTSPRRASSRENQA